VIAADLPWNSFSETTHPEKYENIVSLVKRKQFDAAVIFSAYSDNSLPAALLAFQAGIPKRLSYCRENANGLLTHFIADKEPYSFIQHQVERNLSLVASIGAKTINNNISIHFTADAKTELTTILERKGVDINRPYFVLNATTDEARKEFPSAKWAAVLNELHEHIFCPVILTGTNEERSKHDVILSKSKHCVDLRDELSTDLQIALIAHATLLLSVHSPAIHIAAGTHTPVVVLYALTNPQHTPWKVPSAVLPFSVNKQGKINNEVVRYVFEKMPKGLSYPDTAVIVKEAIQLIAIVKPAVLQHSVPIIHN